MTFHVDRLDGVGVKTAAVIVMKDNRPPQLGMSGEVVYVGIRWLRKSFPLTMCRVDMLQGLLGRKLIFREEWVDPADLAQFKLGKGEL